MRRIETLRVENDEKKEIAEDLMNKWVVTRVKDRIRYDTYKHHMKLLDEDIKKKKQSEEYKGIIDEDEMYEKAEEVFFNNLKLYD